MGTDCSIDRRDAKISFDIIPDWMSERNSYVRNKSTWSFSGVESEEELILARAGIFTPSA